MNPQLVSSGGLLRLASTSPAIGYANTSCYATSGVLRRPLTTSDVGPNAP